MSYNIVRVHNRGVFMNSGKNGQNGITKVFIGAVMALAVVVLILFATGRLDGLFSGDDTVIPDNSPQNVSDSINNDISDNIPESVNSMNNTGSTDSSDDTESNTTSESIPETAELHFRNSKLLEQHYQKHGIDMGFDSAEEYEKAAAAVVANPEALHKTEAEDGDDVYYIESTNEFVIVSTDGYLRTYFNPDKGIDYFNRQ